MNKKIAYVILLVIIILAILGLLYFFLIKKGSVNSLINKNKTVDTEQQANQDQSVKKIEATSNQTDTAKIDLANRAMTKEDIARTAANFAERFGSYSNHANFKNLVDLQIMMTDKMKNWTEDYLAQQKKATGEIEAYVGIVTKVTSTAVKDFDDGSGQAVILVHTRRQEASDTTSNITKVYNQDIIVNLVKEGKEWKIDSANWQEQ